MKVNILKINRSVTGNSDTPVVIKQVVCDRMVAHRNRMEFRSEADKLMTCFYFNSDSDYIIERIEF
jgi:hypothetical protein